MKIRHIALFGMIALVVAAIPAAADTYLSTFIGDCSYEYDGNPNGIFPDYVGYGNFLAAAGDYMMILDFPPTAEGLHDWYLEPYAVFDGMIAGQIPVQAMVDEAGIRVYLAGNLAEEITWADEGLTWVPGKGLYITTMVTPAEAFPADPDRLLGIWSNDYEWDGQDDVIIEITGAGGAHHVDAQVTRSMSWVGANGTGLLNEFLDWVDSKIPGLPLEMFYDSDLSFVADIDAYIYAFGGPVEGADIVGTGTCNVTLRAEECATAVESSSWSAVKALF